MGSGTGEVCFHLPRVKGNESGFHVGLHTHQRPCACLHSHTHQSLACLLSSVAARNT